MDKVNNNRKYISDSALIALIVAAVLVFMAGVMIVSTVNRKIYLEEEDRKSHEQFSLATLEVTSTTEVLSNTETPQVSFETVEGADHYVLMLYYVNTNGLCWYAEVDENNLEEGADIGMYLGLPVSDRPSKRYQLWVFAIDGDVDTDQWINSDPEYTYRRPCWQLILDDPEISDHVLTYGYTEWRVENNG